MSSAEDMSRLAELARSSPEDGQVLFEYANVLDVNDREYEAVAVYRQALGCELSEQDRRRALIQLGSSLRIVGEVEEAIRVHQRLDAESPSAVNRLFLAIALLEAGRSAEAVIAASTTLLDDLSKDDLDRYRPALTTYLGELIRGA